ncbi:MAG TPA: CsiV family protein [Xanthomonadales bacterium]|nr:CsiV family protein [Xanthomonadales bacterium]
MRYKLYLSIFLGLCLIGTSVSAAERSYRIELIVLRHLEGTELTDPQAELRDFTAALDLMPPVQPENEQEAEQPDQTPEPEVLADTTLPREDVLAEEALEEGPRIVLLEEYSDTMRQAWRRLRSSSGFRPEFYLSWEQPDEEPYEVIRVHDLELLFEEDPYFELRAELEEEQAESDVPVFSDVPPEEQAGEPALEEEEALPGPIRYYRIDGTARLSKSRFLHLDLDIEFRTPDYSVEIITPPEVPIVNAEAGALLSERPPAFRVHTLTQNRQVQTREIEYFDGPVISVLALISRIETESSDNSGGEPDAVDSGQSAE